MVKPPDSSDRRKAPRARRVRRDPHPVGVPRAVDIHVGGRLRLRRTLLGMSQEKLGDAVGLTFQQIQKYERGSNRIGASRLFEFGQILDVPVSFFFDDMPEEVRRSGPGRARPSSARKGLGEGAGPEFGAQSLSRRETLELVRAYYRVDDAKVRKRLFELTKSLGSARRAR